MEPRAESYGELFPSLKSRVGKVETTTHSFHRCSCENEETVEGKKREKGKMVVSFIFFIRWAIKERLTDRGRSEETRLWDKKQKKKEAMTRNGC